MAIGPIDPFQNIVGIDTEPPDEIYLICRAAIIFGDHEVKQPSTNEDVAACNPAAPAGMKTAVWRRSAVIVTPSFFGLSLFPIELSDVLYEPPVAVSLLEKEAIDYASSLEEVTLSKTTVDVVNENDQADVDLNLTAPVVYGAWNMSEEFCFDINTSDQGVAVNENGGTFPFSFETLGFSTDGKTVSVDYEIYGPDGFRRYRIGSSEYITGALDGRGVATRTATATFDMYGEWRDEPFNVRVVAVSFAGEEVEYVPIEDTEGDFVHKLLDADGEVVRDDPPVDGDAKALYRLPFAIVLRMKKRIP